MRNPERKRARHVEAAIAAGQAKPAEPTPASPGPARHVQAAMAAGQARATAGPGPGRVIFRGTLSQKLARGLYPVDMVLGGKRTIKASDNDRFHVGDRIV